MPMDGREPADLAERCRLESEYGLLVDGTLRRVRFEGVEEYRSLNPKAIDKRRYRTHFVELREGLSDREFHVRGQVDRLTPWPIWIRAQRAISWLGLQTEPSKGLLGGHYWRLEREQMQNVAREIDRVGMSHPSVAELGWPVPSRSAPFRPPHWRLDLRQLVALSVILEAPDR
ncbi:hypothetical protein IDVR_14780 [Intrasporangium sp. DVR]